MKFTYLILSFSLIGILISTCSAAPTYRIDELGLMGTEHTRSDGYRHSFPTHVDDLGQVVGFSERFNSGSVSLGRSVWIYDGSETRDIGLNGSEHIRSDGYKGTQLQEANSSGYAIGISDRFSGNSENGRSLWLYNGSTTVDIGLKDPFHTRSDGLRFSSFNFFTGHTLNGGGQAIGTSNRFNGGLGETAWVYDGASTIPIGLTGGTYTRDDGYTYSVPVEINDGGQIVGFSDFYFPNSFDDGRTAWLRQGVGHVEIGLVDSEHTSISGRKVSTPDRLNQAGYAIGISYRFQGGSEVIGDSAWLYNGTTTINIGLTGPGYTSSSGYRSSFAGYLNDQGRVIGYSSRYSGANNRGQSAWLYDGNTTIEVGLIGTTHTRDDGFRFSIAYFLNGSGQTVGTSERYGGGTWLGSSAWLFNGTSTTDIGLFDSVHTGSDGTRISYLRHFNDLGQVAGGSYRYNGSDRIGQDAWLHDPDLNQTILIQPSIRSDGFADSSIYYLGDDGLALGTYTLFDEFDNDLGERAFSFTVDEGVQDLALAVDGGLPANGWDFLANAIRANGRGQIIGNGHLLSGSDMAFLLTPITADFDDDGDINGRDFLAWQRGFGKTDAVLSDGDANGDSLVNDEDLAIWQEQYQTGQSLATNVAVPESSAILLAVTALVTQALRRRPAIR